MAASGRTRADVFKLQGSRTDAKPDRLLLRLLLPYGYLASTQIEALAAKHGRGVTWQPMLLGAVFKLTGAKPLPTCR